MSGISPVLGHQPRSQEDDDERGDCREHVGEGVPVGEDEMEYEAGAVDDHAHRQEAPAPALQSPSLEEETRLKSVQRLLVPS